MYTNKGTAADAVPGIPYQYSHGLLCWPATSSTAFIGGFFAGQFVIHTWHGCQAVLVRKFSMYPTSTLPATPYTLKVN